MPLVIRSQGGRFIYNHDEVIAGLGLPATATITNLSWDGSTLTIDAQVNQAEVSQQLNPGPIPPAPVLP